MYNLKGLRNELGLKQSDIAQLFDCKQSNISMQERTNRDLTEDQLNILKSAYSIDIIEKYIYEDDRDSKIVDIKPLIENEKLCGALVYDIDATCGEIPMLMDFAQELAIGSVDLPEINRNSKIVRASGDSMQPVIVDGDRVALREIYNFDDIFYGQIYLIILDEYRMIKYIRKCQDDEKNYLILRSRNPEYDDIKIHKSKIRKLFIVENILSIKTQL